MSARWQHSRRDTLRWIAASSLAAALPAWHSAQADSAAATNSAQGYGPDPDLRHPVVTWALLMQPRQLAVTARLADLILPAAAGAPLPSAVGVEQFVDEWVSAPYPDQVRDRGLLFAGLEAVERDARSHGDGGFLEADAATQAAIVADLALGKGAAATTGDGDFFRRLRYLVVGAYYTTPEGWKDIGYIGNVPLTSYPPVTDQEKALIDAALAKLGLLPA